MSVFNALDAAIYTRLAAGTALTTLLAGGTAAPSVYLGLAPDDADLPYVVFSWQVGPGENQASAHRDPDGLLYVRGYAAAPAQAGSIDAQVDVLLHMKPLSVSGGWSNFWIARTVSIQNVEIDEARVKTWNAGALYRVRLDNS